ncbi:MAG TPA: DUF1801 domain-containing protein [Puia sp.]|jgi:uncharacterized protein YdeI (YjbR/CyaY-like superfamily)
MSKKDKRIDGYIAASEGFARPILNHLRKLVHMVCPEVEETIKWGFPHFEYHGQILCSMASFKQHCSFAFWKGNIMADPDKILEKVGKTGMGHFGRITALSELPADEKLKTYLKEAARLNKEGTRIPKEKSTPAEKKVLVVPDYLKKALAGNKKALRTFEAFSPSNKKEYVDWITGAKTESTRNSRLETALEWMAEGKIRNWKYVR